MINNERNITIAILLATFNGEKYLREQLDSLFAQTHRNWTLYVRDDGSTDKTLDILYEYQNKYENIHILNDKLRRGAKNSFIWMLSHIEADYYMFCDQDDVWLPLKVEKTLEKMLSLENKNTGKAILINTDLTLVDDKLNIIALSMWKYSKINPYLLRQIDYLCVCNFVTGCTMMINNMAKKIALPIAKEAIMHDSWIALQVAANSGILGYLDAPTILYRQHSANVIGAENASNACRYALNKLRALKTVIKKNKAQLKMVNNIRRFSYMKYAKFKFLYLFKR